MSDFYESHPVPRRCPRPPFLLGHKWDVWRYSGPQRGGARYISDCRWCGQRRTNIVFPSTPATVRHTLETAKVLFEDTP